MTLTQSKSSLSKEQILLGNVQPASPSTNLLIEELQKQRKSSRSVIDEKNKVIAEMAKKLAVQSKSRAQELASSNNSSEDLVDKKKKSSRSVGKKQVLSLPRTQQKPRKLKKSVSKKSIVESKAANVGETFSVNQAGGSTTDKFL